MKIDGGGQCCRNLRVQSTRWFVLAALVVWSKHDPNNEGCQHEPTSRLHAEITAALTAAVNFHLIAPHLTKGTNEKTSRSRPGRIVRRVGKSLRLAGQRCPHHRRKKSLARHQGQEMGRL